MGCGPTLSLRQRNRVSSVQGKPTSGRFSPPWPAALDHAVDLEQRELLLRLELGERADVVDQRGEVRAFDQRLRESRKLQAEVEQRPLLDGHQRIVLGIRMVVDGFDAAGAIRE